MERKLDTAGVFERLFAVYGAQFTLLFPAAIILFLPVALLSGVVVETGGLVALVVSGLISVVANFWFQGMAIEAVRDIQDGRRDFTIGGLFRSVVPVLPTLIGVGIVAGIATAIGFVLLIVPGLFLLTIWAVVAPAIVMERRGFDALGRSQELVRGNGWRVFGVIVVVFLLNLVINRVLGAIVGAADSFAAAAIASLVASAITAPISAIAAALIYLELRSVKGEPAPHAGAAV